MGTLSWPEEPKSFLQPRHILILTLVSASLLDPGCFLVFTAHSSGQGWSSDKSIDVQGLERVKEPEANVICPVMRARQLRAQSKGKIKVKWKGQGGREAATSSVGLSSHHHFL